MVVQTDMASLLLRLLLLCLTAVLIGGDTRCYKNDNLGDVEENVYYCYDDAKTDCCQQNNEFTCCEANSKKTLKEQLQLWGTVAALVVVIILLFVCCTTDYSLCNGDDRTFSQRLGLKKTPEPQLTDLSRVGKPEPPTKCTTSFTNSGYQRLPPLPPMTPIPGDPRNNMGGTTKSGIRGRSNSGFVDNEDDSYRY